MAGGLCLDMPKDVGRRIARQVPAVRSRPSPSPRQLVGRIERRHLVALRQRRIVEDRLQEVIEPGTQPVHRLPDV